MQRLSEAKASKKAVGEGLSFVKYGAQLGPKCQQWPSCNHQWLRGACLDLGTGT